MTAQSLQPAQVLSDLLAMPAERRLEQRRSLERCASELRLARAAHRLDDSGLIGALVDEAERLIIADLTQAMEAARMLLPLAEGAFAPPPWPESDRR